MSLSNIIQTKSVAGGNQVTISATLDSPVVSGNSLVAIHWGYSLAVPVTPPEPWTQVAHYGGNGYRTVTVFTLTATASTGQTHEFALDSGESRFCNLILLEIEDLNSVSAPGYAQAGSVTSLSMPEAGGLAGLTVGRTLLTCITGSSGTWDTYVQPTGYTLVDSSAGGSLAGKEITATTEPEAVHSWGSSANNVVALGIELDIVAVLQTVRKGSTFDIETTLGTITTATLNGVNVFDHVTGQVGTTVSFAGAATDEITTSGKYTLALGDGTGTENITVQVNVVGVTPSNNPVQKDGAAQASLTNVQVRITSGANINGTELFYSGTATTDASGNLSNIDLSSTAAADTDPVLLHMRTAAGDSIIASETVGLI